MTAANGIRDGFFAAALVLLVACAAAADDVPHSAGPYVPTPQIIVDRMLQVAKVAAADFVVDLGSGDGRLVRTAARVHGASGFGVDIDNELVERSNAEAQREGLSSRVTFYQQDVFKADVRKASVVTLYVLPEMMVGLRPKLLRELAPGARIVSHDYHFREWLPDSHWTFDVPEKRDAVGFSSTTVFLWIVPAQVAGRWRMEIAGQPQAQPIMLEIEQQFQQVKGMARIGSRSSSLGNPKLYGDALEFVLDATPAKPGERLTYRAKVTGETMEGEVLRGFGPFGKRSKWKAVRLQAGAEALAQ